MKNMLLVAESLLPQVIECQPLPKDNSIMIIIGMLIIMCIIMTTIVLLLIKKKKR